MKQSYFFLSIILFFSMGIVYSQSTQGNLIIRDSVGSVQSRHIPSHIWSPLVAGITISEQSFIRLNSSNSIVTLDLPDGSILRLIGIGSFFIDSVSRPKDNNYQSKILVFSGRWFYSANLTSSTRFIVNTDISTSIIENGAGGGYFHQEYGEFLIREGRGLISYRQQDARAVVVDVNQVVRYNTSEGFFYPKLATEKLFEQYLIFPQQKDLLNLEKFSFLGNSNITNQINKNLDLIDIDIDQLLSLQQLNFEKRTNQLPKNITPQIFEILTKKLQTIITSTESELKNPLDLSFFRIEEAKETNTNQIIQPIPQIVLRLPKKPSSITKRPDPILTKEDQKEEKENIEELIQEFNRSFSNESPSIKVRKPSIVKSTFPPVQSKKPSVIKSTPPPVQNKRPTVIKSTPLPVQNRKPRTSTPPQRQVPDNQSYGYPAYYQQNPNFNNPALFGNENSPNTPSNRDNIPEELKYQINVESLDDLLDSEFTSIFLEY